MRGLQIFIDLESSCKPPYKRTQAGHEALGMQRHLGALFVKLLAVVFLASKFKSSSDAVVPYVWVHIVVI